MVMDAQDAVVQNKVSESSINPNSIILQKIREGIKQTIIKGDFEIPILPHVATEVMKLANDPKTGIMDLERVVKQDQVIAARVIKTANSPFYRGVQEITSLTAAMSRVGLKQIKDIIVSLGIQSQAFKAVGFEAMMDRIWDHSVACAGVSQMIAKKIAIDQDAAFLAGLVHDIGKPIIVQMAAKIEDVERKQEMAQAKMLGRNFDPKAFVIPGLREHVIPLAFNEYHATVGSAVTARWNLPQLIVDVAKHHHDYSKAKDEAKKLSAIVQSSNLLCHHFGLGHDEEKLDVLNMDSLLSLGFTPESIQDLLDDVPETAHKLMGFM